MEIHWMCNSNKLKPIKKCQQQQPKTIAKNIIFKPKQSILKSVWHTNFVFWKKRKIFFLLLLTNWRGCVPHLYVAWIRKSFGCNKSRKFTFLAKVQHLFGIWLASRKLGNVLPPIWHHVPSWGWSTVVRQKTLSSSFPNDGGRVGTMRRNRRPKGTCASS